MFRTRVGLNDFAGNYKKSLKFQPTNWLCRCLSNIENEAHLKEGLCHVYRDIRDKYDTLEDDENQVKYFSEVIARRNALDEDRGGAAPATDALLWITWRASLGDLSQLTDGVFEIYKHNVTSADSHTFVLN